ncbi:site-specific DNA recombinase [Gammaproteobacteria bacterium]
MTTFRYSIWAAVSSERQAAQDKISLPHQVAACRAAAAAKGWLETAGPYLIPGETRTRWINLRDAETALPPLHDLLDAAQRGEFDLLLIYDFTRLRELIDPVARSLAAYGVQIYSLAQTVEPVPPAEFDGKISGTASFVQTLSALTSRTEINTMTKRLRAGVAGRIPKGLHPSGRIPYGYRLDLSTRNPETVPLLLDPVHAAVVVQIKDLYLSGQTCPQISAWLKEQGVPSPRGHPTWGDFALRYLLRNPFYAGEVGLGYRRTHHDPRTGQKKTLPGQPETQPGQHPPLWDAATRQAILNEMRRRGHTNKGHHTYRLSNLLTCSEHHRPFYVAYLNSVRDDAHRVWYCPAIPGRWHLSVRDTQLLERLTQRLPADLDRIANQLPEPARPNSSPLIQDAIADLEARRARLLEALETGALPASLYAQRTRDIETQLAQHRAQLNQQDTSKLDHQQRAHYARTLAQTIRDTPNFITSAPPQLVNLQLRTLTKEITILPDGDFDLLYR